MVIHGLLVTCLDQLALIFNCLKWCVVRGFENVLKKMPCLGNPCNNSLLECFKKVFVFSKRCFKVSKVVLKVCVCEVCFEKWPGLFCKLIK